MAGYKPKRKHYKLVFEDPDMKGLEIIVGALTTDEFLTLTRVASAASSKDDMEAAAAAGVKMIDMLAKHLHSWNVEDEDDKPVSVDRDGVGSQELDFVLEIVTAWMSAIGSVRPPLPEGSPAGATSLEQSLPQVSLSQSHSS